MPRTDDISLSAYADPVARVYEEGVRRRADTLEDCDLRVFRPSPAGARGARGGPQAPGHVHRIHRFARSDALRLGDHRQRRRRGPRRQRQAHRHRPARRRQRRGARHRSRHPGRHRAPHRSVRRRGRLHEAPCRRQVRRRLVRGIGRSARRRGLRRERAVRAARRRGRSRRQDLGDVVPPGRARRLRRQGRALAGFAVHALRGAQRAACHGQGTSRSHRHPHPILGRPTDLHEGRGVPARGARDPRPPDRLPRAGARDRRPRSAARTAQRDLVPLRRRNLGVRRVPRDGCRHHRHVAPDRQRHVHRDRACAAADRGDGAHRGRARVPRRHRRAVGHRLRHRDSLVREHHRHAQGRHAPAGLRSGAAARPAHPGRAERPASQGR